MAEPFRLSFEFFPPKTDKGQRRAARHRRPTARHDPLFYSVTYGAGGSTRDGTFDTVAALARRGFIVAPHLSMGTDDNDAIEALVDRYRALGINRMVALRGDIPSGFGSAARQQRETTGATAARRTSGSDFEIEVAAYPEVHPDAASRRIRISNTSGRRSRPARPARSRSTSTTPTRTSISSHARTSRCRSSRASCRSRTTRTWCASPTTAAPKSRAGSAAASRPTRMTKPRSRVWHRCRHRSVRAARRQRRTGPALLYAEPGSADAGHARSDRSALSDMRHRLHVEAQLAAEGLADPRS